MRTVTKCAMLVLFVTSFIALNNCGNQSGSKSEPAITEDQNQSASDYMVFPGPPPGYPGIFTIGPSHPIEVNCNDGVDNNGNGFTDCADPDCAVHPECSEYGPPISALENERTLTVYPNGLIIPEDIVVLKGRSHHLDGIKEHKRPFFNKRNLKECFIDPRIQDPYYFIPLGEPLVAGPYGAIGPQVFPNTAFAQFGPRAGMINVCGFGTNIFEFGMDDDNGLFVNDDDL